MSSCKTTLTYTGRWWTEVICKDSIAIMIAILKHGSMNTEQH